MTLAFKPYSNPILILNDSPDNYGGLARIGRDIASLLCLMPEFRVGYLARGGVGRRAWPWVQYSYPAPTGQWGEQHIQEVWEDFSGGEDGIIFSLWDASRMLWFGQPAGTGKDLEQFLGPHRRFAKWGYFPVDSTGPDAQQLGLGMRAAVAGYDRVIAASQWGCGVLRAGGRSDAGWIPHGIWMDKFKPNEQAKSILDWPDDNVFLGCNMANQSRKDWPAAFECAALMRGHLGNQFHFWAHTDRLINYWNMYALAADYGLQDCVEVTTGINEEQLALRYSACDATILPTAGEGFGYPIAESLACGTACVTTDYAAGAELVSPSCAVAPVAYRVDTQHNVQRAVLSGARFFPAVLDQVEKKREDWGPRGEELRASVEHLDWKKLDKVWRRWLVEGVMNAVV